MTFRIRDTAENWLWLHKTKEKKLEKNSLESAEYEIQVEYEVMSMYAKVFRHTVGIEL